jgi:hypothetical protein
MVGTSLTLLCPPYEVNASPQSREQQQSCITVGSEQSHAQQVARMSAAICGSRGNDEGSGCRYAHPGYALMSASQLKRPNYCAAAKRRDVPGGDMASHLQMKRGRLSWRPLFPYWSLLGPVFVRRWRDTSRTRRRPRPRRPPRRRAAAMRNRTPLNQKRLCVDLVHEDEWELDGTVRILTHKQPLRAGFAERTLATSSRTYGGCRPCHGSSKLRSRNAQPKPPP